MALWQIYRNHSPKLGQLTGMEGPNPLPRPHLPTQNPKIPPRTHRNADRAEKYEGICSAGVHACEFRHRPGARSSRLILPMHVSWADAAETTVLHFKCAYAEKLRKVY
jgi:hypothetical protein